MNGTLAVGTVVKVGPGVSGFKEGERVGWMPAANTCRTYISMGEEYSG